MVTSRVCMDPARKLNQHYAGPVLVAFASIGDARSADSAAPDEGESATVERKATVVSRAGRL